MKIKSLVKSELGSHIFVAVVYFLLVSILRFKFDFGLLGLWVGGAVGTFLLDIDHLLYWYVLRPEAENSQKARDFIKEKDFRSVYRLLSEVHQTHTRLIFHTVIGQIVLLVLAFYILSSGGSLFGSALVLSVNLHLLKDIWQDYLSRGEQAVSGWLFWQIREIDKVKYFKIYLITTTILFFGLTTFLI